MVIYTALQTLAIMNYYSYVPLLDVPGFYIFFFYGRQEYNDGSYSDMDTHIHCLHFMFDFIVHSTMPKLDGNLLFPFSFKKLKLLSK
jgi:hypothetical protein